MASILGSRTAGFIYKEGPATCGGPYLLGAFSSGRCSRIVAVSGSAADCSSERLGSADSCHAERRLQRAPTDVARPARGPPGAETGTGAPAGGPDSCPLCVCAWERRSSHAWTMNYFCVSFLRRRRRAYEARAKDTRPRAFSVTQIGSLMVCR